MEYAFLGQTGISVSRLGFGCWAIGGHGWGAVDDDDSIRAIRHGLELGINFFDTADVYGLGHSEEVLARALGDDIKRVIIATKFGVVWDDHAKISRDISPARVRLALEGSLRRLKTDCIDLYQVHWPDGKTEVEETMDELKKCQDQGKVRFVGCSNFDSMLVDRSQSRHRLESSQFPYSVITRDAEEKYLPSCEKWRMSGLAYEPLAKGLLTGKFTVASVIGDNDVRLRDPNFGERYQKNLRVVDCLRELGKKYGRLPAQVAIRWVLQDERVSVAITGMKTVPQVADNCGSVEWKLEDADRLLLSEAASFRKIS